jgi:hypothetical protein
MTATDFTAEAALAYLERGWSVFPLKGKLPRVHWQQFTTQRPTREQVEAWWKEWPDAGIGVALGPVSGIVRIDADGEQAIAEVTRLGVPETAEFTTPSGGRGWLLAYMDGCVTERIWRGPGQHQELRVQSTGAYTAIPPSPHPNGELYEWVREEPIAPVPLWLRDRVLERVVNDLARELRPTIKQPDRNELAQALEHIPADEYDRWIQVGMALHSAGDEFFAMWETWSAKSDLFKEGECERKWKSFSPKPGGLTSRSILHWAEQAGWKAPNRHEPLTDVGNARVLSRMGVGKIKHASKLGWLAWDGARWNREDAEKRVQELQKDVLKHRLDRASESLVLALRSDKDEGWRGRVERKQRTIRAIRKHEDDNRIRGARRQAESEPLLTSNHREFDEHHHLFNCISGTLDFATGERPRVPRGSSHHDRARRPSRKLGSPALSGGRDRQGPVRVGRRPAHGRPSCG